MIITEVEALQLRQPQAVDGSIADGSQDALIVRIQTDEGLTGLGEIDSSPSVAKAVIDAPASHKIASGLRALLIGEDPADIDRLWAKMYDGSIYYGRRGVAVHAISGIEIALWDIAGQAAGKPIHALLGEPRRDRVKAYASTLMPDTPELVKEVVTEQLDSGFRAVKLGWGPFGRDADRDVELVAAARAAGGAEFDLMIDIGLGWHDPRDAAVRVQRMAEFKPYWIEEPFRPDDYESYAALVSEVSVPIAAGEEEATVADFDRLISAGNVAIVQPDVTRVGGITECLRVAELARSRGRRCVLHSWSTGIIKAASLHVLAAMEEVEYFEYCVQETALNRELVAETFPLSEDGCAPVPQRPGLGIEIDEDALNHYLVPNG